MEVAYPGSC